MPALNNLIQSVIHSPQWECHCPATSQHTDRGLGPVCSLNRQEKNTVRNMKRTAEPGPSFKFKSLPMSLSCHLLELEINTDVAFKRRLASTRGWNSMWNSSHCYWWLGQNWIGLTLEGREIKPQLNHFLLVLPFIRDLCPSLRFLICKMGSLVKWSED